MRNEDLAPEREPMAELNGALEELEAILAKLGKVSE